MAPTTETYDRWCGLLVALTVLGSTLISVDAFLTGAGAVDIHGPLSQRMFAFAAFVPAFGAAAAYVAARPFHSTVVRLPVALIAMLSTAVIFSIAMYLLSLVDPQNAASRISCETVDDDGGCHNLAYVTWWLIGVVLIVVLAGITVAGTVIITMARALLARNRPGSPSS